MRFSGKPRRGKRGVGSIIGATFIALILLSGFTFYTLVLSIIEHYNRTTDTMGELDWNRNREKLNIKDVRITGANKLNVTVENAGSVSSRLLWIGISNKSVTPETQDYSSLTEQVEPTETRSIVSDLTVLKGKKYVVQLATDLGNVFENRFYPASEVRCALTLVSVSPTAYQGNNITMFLTVTHNDTEVDTIQNITVSLQASQPGLVSLKEQPSSLTIESLRRGESAFFRWVYNTASIGIVTFNATYDQAPAGVSASSTVEILTSPSGGGQSSVAINGVNCTAPYNPAQWNPLGSTQYVSGSVSDLADNDTNYAVFRSYYTGTSVDTNDLVDSNSSNVDGTHSNFTAMQYGPDGIYDTLTEEKTTTNFLVKKGAFAKATVTGSQTVTGVGFLPKSVIFWWTRQTASGELANVQAGYGFATNYAGAYQNRGGAFASNDGAASSVTGRRRSETYSIVVLSSGTTLGAQASVTAFNSDGFVLNWQTNEARADIIHYVALGGTDLTDARAGSFNLAVGTGTQDVTGVGFQPDFAMFLWTYTEALDTTMSHAEIGLGFTVSSAKRGAMVANSENGRATMDTWQQQRNDACILLLDPTAGSQDAIADFGQFLADGFRINKLDAPAGSTPIFYLVLKGGDYDVGSFDSATAAGTQDVTGVGFQPKLVMLATQGRVGSTSIGSTAELAFGAATSATDRGITWLEDPDNLADSDNEMETLDTKLIQWRDRTAPNTFTLRASADFVSFLSNGFRLSWSNAEATGKQIIYVAFGGRNYELNLEVQWTGVDFSQANEYLCIYGGTMVDENLRVDAWTGSEWTNVFASLSTGLNNVSISPYLVSSILTIRFKDATSVGDPTQSSWDIDVSLLHLWTRADEYTSEVEFAGSSNLQTWTQLVWQIVSDWDTGQVAVSIQFYNFTLGGYASSGNGYVSYVSSATPSIDELKGQIITSNLTDFRNATGYWKAKIKGVKVTVTQFLMKVNWIDLETSYPSAGDNIPYGAWQWFIVRAVTATGDSIPYAYLSLFANGTSVVFRNATDGISVPNPAWIHLDANGEFQLELRATNSSSQTFVLSAVVGSVLGQKTVTQEAP